MSAKPEHVEEVVRRIVETVHPLQIILFGSAARGDTGSSSDLDILVVMPEGTHRRHTAQRIYEDLCGLAVPVDIVVATPGDLEKHKDTVGLIYRTVLREGREVYAA